jgi:hypothetical protein
MDPLTSALLAGLVIPLGTDPPKVPTVASVQLRMILVKPGMSETEARAALGLRWETGFTPAMGGLSFSTEYMIGTRHTLELTYFHTSEKEGFVLTRATLFQGSRRVASVPAPDPASRLDPKLVEDVIRAIQQGSGASISGGVGPRKFDPISVKDAFDTPRHASGSSMTGGVGPWKR